MEISIILSRSDTKDRKEQIKKCKYVSPYRWPLRHAVPVKSLLGTALRNELENLKSIGEGNVRDTGLPFSSELFNQL